MSLSEKNSGARPQNSMLCERFGKKLVLALLFVIIVWHAWQDSGSLYRVSSTRHGLTEKPWRYDVVSTKNDLRFFPCPEFEHLKCTNLAVPKDYFNASAGTSTVALAKYPATVKKSKGTIFINPGGPGGSGVLFTFSWGDVLSEIVNGEYDIVGFDPRGIARSRPVVNCFDTQFDFQVFKMGNILEQGFDSPPDPSSPEGYDSLLRQWGAWRGLFAAQYRMCGEKLGDELKYMGTATVVRDIDYMAKIFDGPTSPIHFYGGSYGSILGAYLVSMLPNRVGRVVIEAIANPVMWANNAPWEWLRDWLVDTEKTYKWLLDACVEAGPSLCALGTNSTSDSIAKKIDEYLYKLYYNPIPVTNHTRPGILTAGHARSVLYLATNAPAIWPEISEAFRLALSGNPVALYSWLIKAPALPPQPNQSGDLARSAVSCADSALKPATAEMLAKDTVEVLQHVSRFVLAAHSIEPDGVCEFWPTKGQEPERFTGPWNNTLANPMLIASALSDPITPLSSARLINQLMPHSSRLIISDTPGHGTSSAVGMSLCIAQAYREYYVNGTLPENEKLCPADRKIFESKEAQISRLQALSPRDLALREKLDRSALALVKTRWPSLRL